MLYEIIAIKNNKLYRLLNLNDRSIITVPREKCIELARTNKIINAKCTSSNSLHGINGTNLRLLNSPTPVRHSVREVKSIADKGILADALSNWVYENESRDLLHYFKDLEKPLNNNIIVYRGRILHKSMLKVGAKLYLNRGLVSWTTSEDVAKGFADTHLDHAKEDRFDLQADVSEYEKVVLCIKSSNGSIRGVDVLKCLSLLKSLVEEEILEIAEDEHEILLLNSIRQPELTIVKVTKTDDGYYKLFCNLN